MGHKRESLNGRLDIRLDSTLQRYIKAFEDVTDWDTSTTARNLIVCAMVVLTNRASIPISEFSTLSPREKKMLMSHLRSEMEWATNTANQRFFFPHDPEYFVKIADEISETVSNVKGGRDER